MKVTLQLAMWLNVVPRDCGFNVAMRLAGGNVDIILELQAEDILVSRECSIRCTSILYIFVRLTLLVTGLHGRKCKLGRLKKIDSTSFTLQGKLESDNQASGVCSAGNQGQLTFSAPAWPSQRA